MEVIEQHPWQPPLRCPAPTLPEARQLARLGKFTPSDFAHPDTLQSVTNHSERAQEAATTSKARAVEVSIWPTVRDVRLAASLQRQVQFSWRVPCPVPSCAVSATSLKSVVRVKSTARSVKASTASAYAPTANTTARIAGRPAMSLYPTSLPAEPKRIHMPLL